MVLRIDPGGAEGRGTEVGISCARGCRNAFPKRGVDVEDPIIDAMATFYVWQARERKALNDREERSLPPLSLSAQQAAKCSDAQVEWMRHLYYDVLDVQTSRPLETPTSARAGCLGELC